MPDCHDLGQHALLAASDFLYRRVLPDHIRDGVVLPAHCPTAQWREGLSCDWSVLSGPDETAVRKGGSLPADILSISVAQCRDLDLDVRHCPVVDRTSPDYNLAHCLLHPPDSSKSAIRKLRDDFLARATLIRVEPGISLRIRSFFRRFQRKRRAALHHLMQALREQTDTET